jgi:Ca-activated chloride channel family protein
MTAVRFDIETDRPLVRKESRTRYVLARIVAPEGKPRQRPPVNLALILDRSGSMGGEKIRLAKEAAVSALRRLEPRDRLAVVFYDDRIDVVVPSAPATNETVEAAVRAIRDVEARGSTNLCGGWMRGCEQIALVETPGAVSRAILLTDGLANAGVTDPSEIAGHAAELRRRGIATSTIGVGADFDEHLLGGMADAGGGNYYYVERTEQIAKAIETEVGEALEVTLRETWLRVGPASLAEVTPLAPYRTRRAGDDWVIELGDLVSLQDLAVPLRVAFMPTALADPGKPAVGLTFALGAGSAAAAEAVVQWRLAPSAEVGAQPRNRGVDRAVADAYAALARREAGRLNRAGDFDAARERLAQTRARIGSYAGDDSFLNDLVRQLERDAVVHAEQMTVAARKTSYAASYSVLRSRAPEGESRRAPRPKAEGSKPAGSPPDRKTPVT